MELAFLVAGAAPCFGCDVRTMLTAHWCFQLLLGHVYTKSRTFHFLVPCQPEGWRGTRNWEGTQPGQVTPTSQRDIPHHIECHGQYINQGALGGGKSLPRDWLGISQQMVSNCVVPQTCRVLWCFISLLISLFIPISSSSSIFYFNY